MEPLKTQSKHTITDYKRDKTRITRFLLVLVGMQNQNNSSCDPHQTAILNYSNSLLLLI